MVMVTKIYHLRGAALMTIGNTRFFTFDLDLGVMVTQNVSEYPPHHVTHGPGKFEVATSTVKEVRFKENTLFDLDLGIWVTLNIVQHPLHQVTYSPSKF